MRGFFPPANHSSVMRVFALAFRVKRRASQLLRRVHALEEIGGFDRDTDDHLATLAHDARILTIYLNVKSAGIARLHKKSAAVGR
jgi:hypothetical protein